MQKSPKTNPKRRMQTGNINILHIKVKFFLDGNFYLEIIDEMVEDHIVRYKRTSYKLQKMSLKLDRKNISIIYFSRFQEKLASKCLVRLAKMFPSNNARMFLVRSDKFVLTSYSITKLY